MTIAFVSAFTAWVALIVVVAVFLPRTRQQPRAVGTGLLLIVVGTVLMEIDHGVVGAPIMVLGALVIAVLPLRNFVTEDPD